MDFGGKTTASAVPTKYKVNSPMQKRKNKTKKVIRVKNICLVLVMSMVAAGL